METVTDKKTTKIRNIKEERVRNLESDLQKISFQLFRNAMLEIFPHENAGASAIFNDITLEYAENFSLILSENLIPKIEEYIKDKINEIVEIQKKEIQQQLSTLNKSITAQTTATPTQNV